MCKVALKLVQWTVPTGYAGATVCVLFVTMCPLLNKLLLYGKTANDSKPKARAKHSGNNLIGLISALTVPKSWFAHFYVLLIANCLAVFYSIGGVPTLHPTAAYLGLYLVLVCLLIQGMRRLYECLFVLKQSVTARINVLHYLVGIFHYTMIVLNTFMGMQVVGDEIGYPCKPMLFLETSTLILFVWFLLASYRQFKVHSYLASLVKYSPPAQFKSILNPHYWYEIQIYASIVAMAWITQGPFKVSSLGYLCGFIFVATNLAVSSRETHLYYAQQWPGKIQAEYRIFPGLW